MKTIKLFIISVLLLSSFQALAGRYTNHVDAYENENKTATFSISIDSISFFESNIDADQFILNTSGITLKKQNYEALENKIIRLETRIKLLLYENIYFQICYLVDQRQKPKQDNRLFVLDQPLPYEWNNIEETKL
jgi:hypothetical protein